MRATPSAAVILAAGLGSRLAGVWSDLPKGFIEIGGETLIERSLRLLRERGIGRVVIVAGHLAAAYHELAARCPGVEVVVNEAYADTGSRASLACALEVIDQDFLLLESDLLYEARALDALLACDWPDALLVSGPTGATDEVWVEAREGRLLRLSKRREELDAVSGELVGILRASRGLARGMGRAYRAFVHREGHARMAYETDALVEAARARPVRICLEESLHWGEIDYERHYARVRDEVAPKLLAREARGPATRSLGEAT